MPVSRHFDDGLLAGDRGRDRQPPALRHRVASVEQEIQKDLLQLVLDASNHNGGAVECLPHLNLAHLELVLEQRQHVVDGPIQVDRPGLAA